MDLLTKLADMINQYAAGRVAPFAKLDSELNINAVGSQEMFKALTPEQGEKFVSYASQSVVLWDKNQNKELNLEVTHPIIRLVVMKKIQHTLTNIGENL